MEELNESTYRDIKPVKVELKPATFNEIKKIINDRKNHTNVRKDNGNYSFNYKREGESVSVNYKIVPRQRTINVTFTDTHNMFRMSEEQQVILSHLLI